MARRRPPLITLTTDFGYVDSYVAEMKAVLFNLAPRSPVIDVTHHLPPQDIQAGAVALDRVVRSFPKGSVHLAVVDPGVGFDRRLLLARVNGQFIIAPDNGLVTWAWLRHAKPVAYELTWRPSESSHTFHGRDIMAPIIGRIAAGRPWRRFVGNAIEPVLIELALARRLQDGRVIHIDHFGNATTNVPGELLAGGPVHTILIRRRRVPLNRTYADVSLGKPLALIGSSGLLEIAVRNGSAARVMRLRVGDRLSAV